MRPSPRWSVHGRSTAAHRRPGGPGGQADPVAQPLGGAIRLLAHRVGRERRGAGRDGRPSSHTRDGSSAAALKATDSRERNPGPQCMGTQVREPRRKDNDATRLRRGDWLHGASRRRRRPAAATRSAARTTRRRRRQGRRHPIAPSLGRHGHGARWSRRAGWRSPSRSGSRRAPPRLPAAGEVVRARWERIASYTSGYNGSSSSGCSIRKSARDCQPPSTLLMLAPTIVRAAWRTNLAAFFTASSVAAEECAAAPTR